MALKTPDLPVLKMEASITVLNELTAALGAHGVLPHYRPSRDGAGNPVDPVTAAAASSLSTSQTLAKALAVALEAHGADYGEQGAHSAVEAIVIAAWASKPAEPANLTEVQNVLNEVKADFNTHLANTSIHRGVAGAGRIAQPAAIATADASDQTTANTLANALKAALNAHMRAGAQTISVIQS